MGQESQSKMEKNILNKKPHYKNLRGNWQYSSSWFKKISISHWGQRIWCGFIFSLPFHSYILSLVKLELKNIYRTFFNGLFDKLNKMRKKSKILEIYSLQMNEYLLYAQWKMKNITSLSSAFHKKIIIVDYGFLQNHSHLISVIRASRNTKANPSWL